MATKAVRPAHRPSSYSPEVAEKILAQMSDGVPLLDICAENGFPDRRTIYRWTESNEEFRLKYARARELCGDAAAERAVREGLAASAEDAHAARVRFDALRWWASKVAPRTYGDKTTTEHTGSVALQHDAIDRPPAETREEWIARRQRELDAARLALAAPAGSAD